MQPAPPFPTPVDRLIRDLVQSGRPAMPAEVVQIRTRLATARFFDAVQTVRGADRHVSYLGETLNDRADTLWYHVCKRVVIERQWAYGTTRAAYLDDLAFAVQRLSQLGVYERRGGTVAVALARTLEVLPYQRLGAVWLPLLLVVISADRGIIVSGYQISALEAAAIPGDIRWLT